MMTDPESLFMRAVADFWSQVDRSRGDRSCWEWRGSVNELRGGYGYFKRLSIVRKYGAQRVHRIAYLMLVGPIPDGLELDHLCHNRICVNPTHLEPVTGQENMRRSRPAQKTHCVNGHEYTPENTYLSPKTGRRQCRPCRTNAERKRRAAGRPAA